MIWLATLSHALVMHPCFMINPLSSGCIEEKTRNKNYKESIYQFDFLIRVSNATNCTHVLEGHFYIHKRRGCYSP